MDMVKFCGSQTPNVLFGLMRMAERATVRFAAGPRRPWLAAVKLGLDPVLPETISTPSCSEPAKPLLARLPSKVRFTTGFAGKMPLFFWLCCLFYWCKRKQKKKMRKKEEK